MKALTVKQPWAALIQRGVKAEELRSWRTNYRGPLAIHAGRQVDDQGVRHLMETTGCDAPQAICWTQREPRGKVVCIVDVVGMRRTATGWAWQLANPRDLATPERAIGQQGLWDWQPKGEPEQRGLFD